MRISGLYSHLNGKEYMHYHHPGLWKEIEDVIASVDAERCRTKKSKEQRRQRRMLFSPKDMNREFREGFERLGWSRRKSTFWLANDEKLMRDIYQLERDEQKARIIAAGHEPIRSLNETDFVKDRVAVEVQFGKYSFVAHDLFVKHLSFFVSDIIDIGIEILPMKAMEREMSSGVPYFERDLLNVIRQGRGVPAVPLVLIGVAP